MLKKFIPTIIKDSIYDIDYNKLYQDGKKYLLCDLDNTIIPYDVALADDRFRKLLKDIQNIGLKLIIVSNNHKKRVRKFSDDLNIKSFHDSLKPLKFGLRRALKYIRNNDYPNKKIKDIKKYVITIGDQLMTDVFASSRIKLDSILVHPLKKKTEKWYTRFNRRMERMIIKKISKKYPTIYEELKEKHEY